MNSHPTIMADSRKGNEEAGEMRLAEMQKRMIELTHEAMPLIRDSEHVLQFSTGYLNTDSGEKADEHGAGEEIGQKAEPQDRASSRIAAVTSAIRLVSPM